MRASTRKGANFGNGRPADLSEVLSSVLPHLPSLSLQLSGELYDSGKRSRGFPLMESPFSDALPPASCVLQPRHPSERGQEEDENGGRGHQEAS